MQLIEPELAHRFAADLAALWPESERSGPLGLAVSGGPDSLALLLLAHAALPGRIAAATDKDLVISRITGTIAADKAYSVYMSGLYDATAKTVDGFVVEDVVPANFDYTQALVRFVNASHNSQPMTLFATNTVTSTESPVGAAVAYKAAGAFTALPAGVYNLGGRVAGSATNVFARASVSFVAGRVYTITARGDATVATTGTAVNRAFLDNTLNR